MPLYLGNIEVKNEYVDSYQLGEIYLGTTLIQSSPNPNPFIIAVSPSSSVTLDGDYKIHTFTTTGTSSFNIIQTGSGANNSIEYLIVAAGGAGDNVAGGDGGGAGGLLSGSFTPTSAGLNSIIVGNGVFQNNGENSSAFGILSYGGGCGTGTSANGGSGAGNGYTVSASQGNNGGIDGPAFNTPGGGGAGQVGQYGTDFAISGSCPNNLFSGAGGSGSLSSISGISTYYAGGGGGGAVAAGSQCYRKPGIGGVGGGGNGGGSGSEAYGKAGAPNTGGGGGGLGNPPTAGYNSGNGGSGIIILRYKYK
jgi:hypothetical protein